MSIAAAVLINVTGVTAAPVVPVAPASSPGAAVPTKAPHVAEGPAAPAYVDTAAKLSIVPPPGWVRGPGTALNPQNDPPDPVLELVRFQLRVGDASLYAQPIPLTSGLLLDAKAVISVGLVREGSDLADIAIDPRVAVDEAGAIPGFVTIDDESSYEGLHTLVRIFVARDTDRRIVVRAVASEDDWDWLLSGIRMALASFRADPTGPNAPAAAPPPPPPAPAAAPQPGAPARDASLEVRSDIIDRARDMLGTPYVWGGNSPGRGMDCSAYVSRAWGVSRYTTDSIWAVADAVSKDELRAGDAMDLVIGRDADGFGHIRLFEAWANESRSAVWVYEETPPRAVHRVVAYDSRYQPIRLDGLSGAGVAALIPAPVSGPERAFVPTVTRPRAAIPTRTSDPRTILRPSTPHPTATAQPTTTRRPPTATPRPATTARPVTTVPLPDERVAPFPNTTTAPPPHATTAPLPAMTGPARTSQPTVRPTASPTVRSTAAAAPRAPAPRAPATPRRRD